MQDLETMQKRTGTLERLLRLQSMLIALKMLRDESEIPADAVRPVRDLGHHLSFCQALAWTRRL
jgi:uncharacterized protein (DUF169 family)